jgi:hypothetical protein
MALLRQSITRVAGNRWEYNERRHAGWRSPQEAAGIYVKLKKACFKVFHEVSDGALFRFSPLSCTSPALNTRTPFGQTQSPSSLTPFAVSLIVFVSPHVSHLHLKIHIHADIIGLPMEEERIAA